MKSGGGLREITLRGKSPGIHLERSIMVLMLILLMMGCASAWPLPQATFGFANPEEIPGFPHGIFLPDPVTNSLLSLWSG